MDILMVVPHEVHVEGGGISNHALHLSKHLIKLKHTIEVIALSETNQHLKTDDFTLHNVASYHLPPFPYASLAGFTIPKNFYNIKKILLELIHQGIDVIHVHGHHYPLTWYTVSIAHKLNIPCVLTLHGTSGLDHEYPFAYLLETAFNRTILTSALEKVNAIIGLTPKVTNYIKKYVSEKTQFFTIPNGIYLNHFQNNLHNKVKYRKKYGLPTDKKIILFRGRFSKIKGVLELLQVLPSILEQHSDIFILFVGDGPLRKQILTMSEIVGHQKMMVLNWTPYANIHELYIASDIYILPSKREALPITMLEAMASHLHIVTTQVGGIPDILSGYPWKTYITDLSLSTIIQTFHESISQINTPRSESEEQVSISYLNNFRWTKIAKETENVYNDII